MRRVVRELALAFVALETVACTTLEVTPEIASPLTAGKAIPGAVEYAGNVADRPTLLSGAEGPGRFVYHVEVQYDYDDYPTLLVLFNPLTLLGFPSGTLAVAAHASLEVHRGDEVLKTYRADALLTQRKNLYTLESQTELRRRSLVALRDSIDAQLARDFDTLYPKLRTTRRMKGPDK